MSKKAVSSPKKGQDLTDFPPSKIKIDSDGSVIELENSDLKNDLHTYRYSKAKFKKGDKLVMSSEQIKLQLTNYFSAVKI